MARIGKSEHARILHLADAEGRKVADIAAEYGCSAANIYALLGKLRRASPAAAIDPVVVEAPVIAPVAAGPASDASVVDLFAAPPPPVRVEATPAPARPTPAPPRPIRADKPAIHAARPMLKQGYGLVTRSPEGEENVVPFRSLDDLLGAVKPILRAAAGGCEPAWFCIRPVDLASLEEDAA